MLTGRRHARIVHRGDLHSHRRVVRDNAPAAVFPLQLLFFRGAENADRLLHARFVQQLIGRGEFGQPVKGEVDLHERGAMIATGDPRNQFCRNMFGRDELGERDVRRQVGHHDRRGDRRPVT